MDPVHDREDLALLLRVQPPAVVRARPQARPRSALRRTSHFEQGAMKGDPAGLLPR